MGFDAKKAKALAPGEAIIVDDAPGLRLKATESTKTWTYRFKSPVTGGMRQVALGQWPSMTYAQALGAWSDARDLRATGVDLADRKREKRAQKQVAQEKRVKDSRYTVRKLIDEYLDEHVARHRKPKGVAEMRRLMGEGYTAAIADLPAASIKRVEAFGLLEALGKRAPVLANILRSELGAAWDHALDAGRLSEETPNWWRQILRGKLRSKGKIVAGKHQGVVKRILNDSEMAALLRFMPNFTMLIEDILTLYLWTGARGMEIVAMEGSEIAKERDGWWWTIPQHKLKMARFESVTDLRIPLVGRALTIVKRRVDVSGSGYLFPAQRGDSPHVHQKVTGVAVWATRPTTVTDRLGKGRAHILHIASWAPHDLRRTVRTKLSALGCNKDVAEAVIGHMPAGIAGVYDRHTYDKERRQWLTRLAAHWEGLVKD